MPKKDGGKRILACSCGFKNKDVEAGATIKEVVKTTKSIEVIEEEKEVYPLVEVECTKCKNRKAYFWTVQTRASDEPETKFYKCQKCKYTWRDYS